jgi:hypothetical protein
MILSVLFVVVIVVGADWLASATTSAPKGLAVSALATGPHQAG